MVCLSRSHGKKRAALTQPKRIKLFSPQREKLVNKTQKKWLNRPIFYVLKKHTSIGKIGMLAYNCSHKK